MDFSKLSKQKEPKELYKSSVPDYLRVSEFYLDHKNMDFPDRINVLCKTNGWLMVDGKTRNRNDAYEKKVTNIDCRYTSPTSPPWMQHANETAINVTKQKALRKETVRGDVTKAFSRVEKNRVILFDTMQPMLSGDH